MNPYEKTVGIGRVITSVERKRASLDDFVDHISVYVPELNKGKEYDNLMNALEAYDSYLKCLHATYFAKHVESKGKK